MMSFFAALYVGVAHSLLVTPAVQAADQATPVVVLTEPTQSSYEATSTSPYGTPTAKVPIKAKITVSATGYSAGASISGSITCSYSHNRYPDDPTYPWLAIGHSESLTVTGTADSRGEFNQDYNSTAGTNIYDENFNVVGRQPIGFMPGPHSVKSSASVTLNSAGTKTGTSAHKTFTVTDNE